MGRDWGGGGGSMALMSAICLLSVAGWATVDARISY